MKKIMYNILVAILLIATLLLLTGCNQKQEEQAEPEVAKEKLEYFDERSGNKTTFEYPAEDGFEVTGTEDSGAFKEINFKNENLNLAVNMYYISEYDDSFERNQENNKEQPNYKEYTANGYTAFSYTTENETTLHTKILLKPTTEDENQGLSLYLYVEKNDYSAETNLKDAFYGDIFQNFLNTLTFEAGK